MIDLRAINRDQFSSAKRYWAAALIVKLLIFFVGTWAVFLATPIEYLPQLLLTLAITSEILQLKSDGTKSQAERLLRTLDICQSFGREISEADKRDIVLGVPKSRRKDIEKLVFDRYFDSNEVPGPKKAVDHLIESAWHTRQQAAAMAGIYGVLIAALIIVSVAALFAAARDISDPVLRNQIVRVATAWLLLIVSLNMLKSIWAYFKLYQRCQQTEIICGHLAKGEVSEVDALKQWYEYQVARSSSPLLPDWLWRSMRSSLDEAWRLAKQ